MPIIVIDGEACCGIWVRTTLRTIIASKKGSQFNFSLLISDLLSTTMHSIRESRAPSESHRTIKEKRTRRRVIKCCENCRSSKNKCSKDPDACKRCREERLECVYLPQDDEGWEIIEKGKEERRKIENRIAKRARREENWEGESEDGSDIEPSPLIATDAAHEDDDDIEDNGVRVGRFNLTKRIGCYYRPKMIEEASTQ